MEAQRKLHYSSLYVWEESWCRGHVNSDVDAYIIFQTLLGSVVMYSGSNLAYIDALFFASGSATQSGLNTYVYYQ
jgi:hypothetical protein